MFSLGLIDKISLFNQPSVFTWVFRLNNLVKVLIPKICAADDLSLDWNNQNQLEFIDQSLDIFDDFSNDLFNVKKPGMSSGINMAPAMGMPMNTQNIPFEFNYNYQPLFNDFLPTNSDIFPSSVSSVETSSPLDEELYKKKESKKRTFDDFDNYDNFKKPKTMLYDEKVRYELDNFQKFSSNQYIKLESDLQVSPFGDHSKISPLDDSVKISSPSTTTTSGIISPKKSSFDCTHCNASFKVKGYLTRHLKKHNSSKAFACPFYQESGILGTKCHPTGGFSRRDTFKTHLRALHFIYPPGTKSSERNSTSGRCAGCFEYFNNNFDWLVNHIEAGVCTGTVIAREESLD